ncbi:MAG: hypothetical protein JWO42_4082 [Chloroflexi bacterium]|nr:hypothetical protein [Chloroflexota bacterium]
MEPPFSSRRLPLLGHPDCSEQLVKPATTTLSCAGLLHLWRRCSAKEGPRDVRRREQGTRHAVL